jgi:NAD(P)-dependent dehydrogenase (short-subunit alcohol dehydrogenase family)
VFDGKTCIVTGGTSGIGLAISEALLKRGAVVYMVGIPEESVKAASEKLSGYEHARFAVVDVTRYDDVQGIVDRAVEETGSLDYMFNNAGMGATVPFENVTLENWKTVIDLNLWGIIHGVHAAFHVMLKQGSGHIVNTSSIAGVNPPPYQALYCATKYAVTGMTESLRYEHAYRGIAFSTLCPYNVATPIFKDTPPEDSISPEEAAGYILDGVERKEGIIVFPETTKELYLSHRADQAKQDAFMFEMADERRKAYETGGRYY